MCGFVGFLALTNESAPTEAWISTLIDTIAHRGPDDHGILVDGRAALGFRRLSIRKLRTPGRAFSTHLPRVCTKLASSSARECTLSRRKMALT